ncbi:hypothetical protein, partial [Enteroscipio rubneri]|uniref:hypothetical protein n=1 Tax=Enteroscipio rubneri TaxID=2070686 RepID=UPI003AEF5B43
MGRTDAVSAGLVSGEDRFAAGARGGRTSPALGGRRAAPEGRAGAGGSGAHAATVAENATANP